MPLVVGLALEERKRRALGVVHDRDPAGSEIERPGQHLAAQLPHLRGGAVARGDREVREPVRWCGSVIGMMPPLERPAFLIVT